MILIIILCLLIVLVLWGVSIYNLLVRLKNAVANAFAQIDVQLTRRYELIPNLVETAKKYMAHEQQTLQAVIQARNLAFGAQQKLQGNPENTQAIKDLGQFESSLGQEMQRLMLVMENYPELKANETMQTLMEELSSTENKVSYSRQAYNDAVMAYNNSREAFPNILLAQKFGFLPYEHLKIENEKAKSSIKVDFN